MANGARTSYARQLAGGASISLAAAVLLGLLAAMAPAPQHRGRPAPKPLSRASALAKGKLLVARRNLPDPNFARSVVLLLEYSDQGAMGLIVNRSTQRKLSQVWPDHKKLAGRPDSLYFGGPVARSHMLLLVRGEESEHAHAVLDDVSASSDQEWLEEMISVGLPGDRLRVYSGHAGWAPGQLEGEVERGDWFLWRGDGDLVFSAEPGDEIWQQLIRYSSAVLAQARAPRIAARRSIARE